MPLVLLGRRCAVPDSTISEAAARRLFRGNDQFGFPVTVIPRPRGRTPIRGMGALPFGRNVRCALCAATDSQSGKIWSTNEGGADGRRSAEAVAGQHILTHRDELDLRIVLPAKYAIEWVRTRGCEVGARLLHGSRERIVAVEFPPAALTEFVANLAHVIETPQGRAYAGSAMVESARRCRDKLQETGLIPGTEGEKI